MMIELGGNIQLVGFTDLDSANMIVLKKIVGNYTKKISENCQAFEKLTVTMKPVHQTEKSSKYELHVKLMDNGTPYVSEVTERNLYVGLDAVLKKIEKMVKR